MNADDYAEMVVRTDEVVCLFHMEDFTDRQYAETIKLLAALLDAPKDEMPFALASMLGMAYVLGQFAAADALQLYGISPHITDKIVGNRAWRMAKVAHYSEDENIRYLESLGND